VEYGVLGPLAALKEGRELALGPPGQRALLAALLIRANEVVPTARIVDDLWGGRPPARAVKTVQVYVSQLRKILGEDAIETRPSGYLVHVGDGALDRERFERLLERGGTLFGAGAAAEAEAALVEALALWRGPALADFQDEAFARDEIGRLEELRLIALSLRLEANLDLGRHAEVVPELEALVREYPLREKLRELLILALYRAGRQADALAAYHDARTTLVDELGLDPGRTLRQLEKAILLQDPSLDLAPRRPAGLPTGTVTFLFSDIEGSTGVLERLGGTEYARVLDEHRRLLRAAFAATGGREVDTQGDAFFAAFPSAAGAVRAAARVQRELAGSELSARIGIHTGEPLLGATGYVGLDVPRAARICAAGHGGQVLISPTTRELVEADLPDGVSLRDLGEHRLKDLSRAERLAQLVIDGIRNDFPPLRTLENRPTNLPVQVTPLIGRQREVADVLARLRSDEVRLLTLTGPGGAGKTRLALQAAAELMDDFPDGVFFVALAPMAGAALVLPTIAQTLALRESGSSSLVESLEAQLASRRVLLVIDNFEHVTDAAPDLGALLAAARGLRILVTSRIPVHLSAEHEYPVPALDLPDPHHLPEPSSLSQFDAVELFVERARAVRPDFEVTNANAPAVAELCVRLDGMPLAIELAAARAKVLSPQALLARLEQRFDLLIGGPRDLPERQRTLRATIDWSYGLLEPDERTLFARLAVFAGGCSLAAAETVCGGPDVISGLAALVDGNMVRRDEQADGEPRFAMLETIRAYALERLDADPEADEIRRRHSEWFTAVDERMMVDDRTFRGADLSAFVRDVDNYRSALRDASSRNDGAALVRLVWNLRFFWIQRGDLREGADWCEEALRLSADLPRPVQARAAECAGSFAFRRAELERAAELFARAVELRVGDGPGDALERAWNLRMLGLIAAERGDGAGADALLELAAAGFSELGDRYGTFAVLHDRGIGSLQRGDDAAARPLLEQSVAEARDSGSDDLVANALLDLAILELRERRHAESRALFAESLELALGRGFRSDIALALRGLAATAAADSGRLGPSARLLAAADCIDEETGWPMQEYERAAFAEVAAAVRARADEPDIAAAVEAGARMSDAEAAAYALAVVGEGAAH
jgi:predicted ATPase/DNA-binding SARP family transcriptional activator